MMLECVIIVVSFVIITARPVALNEWEVQDVKAIESQSKKPMNKKTDSAANNSRKKFFGDS